MVPLILIAFWRTHIHLWRIVGIVAAFIGLFLMTVPAGKDGIADFARINTGDLLTMGCAVSFAFQIILLGRATQRFDFKQIAVLQIVVAAVLMFVSLPLLEKPHLQLSSTLIWGVAVTGIFCTALAFAVQSWAQQFTPATHTALIFTLEPVFAWITSFVVMHERLGIRAGAGALLIMAGVLLSELLGNVQQPEPELAIEPVGSDAR
jgi:drug/metabolite transporter (DMT)-like permease